jgi:hypothetical protein
MSVITNQRFLANVRKSLETSKETRLSPPFVVKDGRLYVDASKDQIHGIIFKDGTPFSPEDSGYFAPLRPSAFDFYAEFFSKVKQLRSSIKEIVIELNDVPKDTIINSGKIIYVNNITGSDTRTGKTNYAEAYPFKTIEAAIEASSTTPSKGVDLIYVCNGNYTITREILLDGKGNLYFEPGVNVTVATSNAFRLTTSESKFIKGYANFIVTGGSVLTQTTGVIDLECIDITGTSSATLFNVSGGTLNIGFSKIEITTASVFNLTGTSSLTVTKSQSANCKQFISCNTTGSVLIDIQTVKGNAVDGSIKIIEHGSFIYNGKDLDNTTTNPCVYLDYLATGTGPIFKGVTFRSSNIPVTYNYRTGVVYRKIYFDTVRFKAGVSSSYIITVLYPPIDPAKPETLVQPPISVYSLLSFGNKSVDTTVTVEGPGGIALAEIV